MDQIQLNLQMCAMQPPRNLAPKILGAFPKNPIISKFSKPPVFKLQLAQTTNNVEQMRQKVASVPPNISEQWRVKDCTMFAKSHFHKDLN